MRKRQSRVERDIAVSDDLGAYQGAVARLAPSVEVRPVRGSLPDPILAALERFEEAMGMPLHDGALTMVLRNHTHYVKSVGFDQGTAIAVDHIEKATRLATMPYYLDLKARRTDLF